MSNNLIFNVNDYHNGFQNNQRILKTNSGEDKDDKFIYFITSIIGSAVTISDKDSNALFTIALEMDFAHPIRLDGGFEISGTDSAVIYYVMPKGIN